MQHGASVAFPWTPLVESRRRTLLAGMACALAAALVTAVVVARWMDSTRLLGLPLLLALGAAAGAFGLQRRRAPVREEIRIDARGAIEVRRAGEDAPVRPLYTGTWLIVLTSRIGRIIVWRDALDRDRFRRLSAAARWRIERGPHAGGQGEVGRPAE